MAWLARPQVVVHVVLFEKVKFVSCPYPVPFTVVWAWPAGKNGPSDLTQLATVAKFAALNVTLCCQSKASCPHSWPIEALASSGRTEPLLRKAVVVTLTFPKPAALDQSTVVV